MSGKPKLTPIDAFQLNMDDAHQLVKRRRRFPQPPSSADARRAPPPRWRRAQDPRQPSRCSTAPNKVGMMLSLVGVDDWSKKLDAERNVKGRGETVKFLDRITERRNRIAHQGDRAGRGRAALTVDEVKADLAALESIVHAIEAVLSPPNR